MLRLLREISQNGNRQSARGGQGARGGGANRNYRTLDNANFSRRLTALYCHIHEGCNHLSADCNSKAPGHKDEAMMDNRMGGSNTFC